MSKTAIITGGFGFLGRNTARALKQAGFNVYGIGRGSWEIEEEKLWGFDQWRYGNITIDALNSFNIKPEIIVHCGGGGSVAYSIQEPYLDYQNTVASTAVVLEFIRLSSPNSRIIYPSSAAVYGVHANDPIKLNDPLHPVSPYGYYKKMAEELCQLYHKEFGIKYSVIRYFSIYGSGLRKQLLWDASVKLSKNVENVEFWGTGQEIRDWIHVSDAVSLIYKASQSQIENLIINGGSGIGHSVSEVLNLLKQCLNSKSNIQFNGKTKIGDPEFYIADISDTSTNWKPTLHLEKGLCEYVDWFKREYL